MSQDLYQFADAYGVSRSAAIQFARESEDFTRHFERIPWLSSNPTVDADGENLPEWLRRTLLNQSIDYVDHARSTAFLTVLKK